MNSLIGKRESFRQDLLKKLTRLGSRLFVLGGRIDPITGLFILPDGNRPAFGIVTTSEANHRI